ncbi:hypothetical protein GGR56DRAFT_669574 [Xylariaceae sp. FL0804]|nr:hypothetical protein GGR56DRAFT_669574 [Xylariaceae sp. FL0804]
MTADPNATSLVPTGLAAAILAMAFFFFVLSILTVAGRTMVRLREGCFGVDDGLMLAGLALFMVVCGLASYDACIGLGSRDEKLNEHMAREGRKYIVLWQIFYVLALCCIKAAIGTTLLRIAVRRAHRALVWALVAVTCATSLAALVGVLATCRPVAASWDWDAWEGACGSARVISGLGYLVSASSVVTDWACAVLPVVILWRTQMPARMKVSTGLVLGLGAIASISTIIRLPYLRFYSEPDNYLFHIGYVVLWSIIECGIGLIAGSLPMLRRLFRRWLGVPDPDPVVNGAASPLPLPPLSPSPSWSGSTTRPGGGGSSAAGRPTTLSPAAAAAAAAAPDDRPGSGGSGASRRPPLLRLSNRLQRQSTTTTLKNMMTTEDLSIPTATAPTSPAAMAVTTTPTTATPPRLPPLDLVGLGGVDVEMAALGSRFGGGPGPGPHLWRRETDEAAASNSPTGSTAALLMRKR